MAVAKDKTRIKVTLHRDLAAMIKKDADAEGMSVSAYAAKILYDHYLQNGQYEPPKWLKSR
jgi:predicted DNA binding CopG/RHH family protein